MEVIWYDGKHGSICLQAAIETGKQKQLLVTREIECWKNSKAERLSTKQYYEVKIYPMFFII